MRRHIRGGPRRRLFWRIYLHSVLVILTVVLSVGLLAHFKGGEGYWKSAPARVAAQVARSGPAAFGAQFELLAKVSEMDFGAYTPEGTLLSGSSTPPPPLDAYHLAELEPGSTEHDHGEQLWAVRLPTGPEVPEGSYLLIQHEKHKTPPFVLALVLLLLMLALVSWPLARALARPLERLTATARALGDGDLSARTGLNRPDEVGQLARAMDDMAGRLAGMLASERALLANVGHELRTPIARLRVALELTALDGDHPGLKGLEQDLGELEQLVEDVLTSARLDQVGLGAMTIHEGPLHPDAVVQAAARRFESRVDHDQRRPLEIHVDPSLASAPPHTGDQALIRRLLDNLLANAARHGQPTAPLPEGEVPFALSVRADQGALVFEVADRGPGVPEAALDRLFDPFYRVDQSRTRATGGVGLGLSLCRRIAEAHGGTLTAAAREGGGLVFTLRLP